MSRKFSLILGFLTLILLFDIPTVQASASTTTVSAYVVEPVVLDGVIDAIEWSDANFYTFSSGLEITFDLYLKHDNSYFYLGMRVQNDAQMDPKDFLVVYFDEGDDDSHGSGSRDGVLQRGQEDLKQIDGAGVLYDGFLDTDWIKSTLNVNFDASSAHHGDRWEFELQIPYQGVEGATFDASDLMVTRMNVIGLYFEFYDHMGEEAFMVYTSQNLSAMNPANWLSLEFDSDSDELFDREENVIGSDSFNRDTDNDGLTDGREVKIHLTNPLESDTDGDDLSDGLEVNVYMTNPLLVDTDGDGLSDREEIDIYETNPLLQDSDGDGLSDNEEIKVHGTDPLKLDSDGDGLNDGWEISLGTSPLSSDSDGDFWGDATDAWPTNFILPNALIVLLIAIISLSVGVFIWLRRGEKVIIPPSGIWIQDVVHIMPGKGYLTKEEKPVSAFKFLKQLSDHGLPSLCITSGYPEDVKREHELKRVQTIWLSEEETKNAISPRALDIMRDTIAEFTKKLRGGVVLIDGFRYLVTMNGFEPTLRFLHDILENIAVNRATLIMSVNPSAFDKRQLAILERNLVVVEKSFPVKVD